MAMAPKIASREIDILKGHNDLTVGFWPCVIEQAGHAVGMPRDLRFRDALSASKSRSLKWIFPNEGDQDMGSNT